MSYYGFEFCTLCNRKVHDWRTHVKSSEHQRASQVKVRENEQAAGHPVCKDRKD